MWAGWRIGWLAAALRGCRRARLLIGIAACLRLAQLLPDFSRGGKLPLLKALKQRYLRTF